MAGPAALLTVPRPLLALIGHLETAEAYRDLLTAARGPDLPSPCLGDVEAFVRVMDPMPVCDVTLRSMQGPVVPARYIDVGLLPDSRAALRRASARIRLAGQEAQRSGARLGVLGGFASILGRRAGLDLEEELGLPFTTGNTLTAAVIAEQVASLRSDLRAATVTVVGAGGDVGSGLCRILHAQGVRVRLVGRARRPLAKLAAELRGAEVLSWPHDARRSDIVVLAASAPLGSIPLEGLPPAAVVLDAGHPPNARSDGRVRYAAAGRVTHAIPPESDLPALLSKRYAPTETHACLAEGMALAYAGRWEAFSRARGTIVPERAEEILGMARRHGIRPATLHFAAARTIGAAARDHRIAVPAS